MSSATAPDPEQLRSRIAHAIATVVLSGPLFGCGLWCIVHRRCTIPLRWRYSSWGSGITLTGTAAVIAGAALLVAAVGLVAHIWLSRLDRLQDGGHVSARFCGALALVLALAALVVHAVN